MTLQTLLSSIDSRAELWADTMWRACWQGAIFIGMLWIVCRVTPRIPGSMRCVLWWLAGLKLTLGLIGAFNVPIPLAPAQRLQTPAPTAQIAADPTGAVASVSPSPLHTLAPISATHASPLLPLPIPARGAISVESASPPLADHRAAILRLCLVVWLGGMAVRAAGTLRQFGRAARLLRTVELSENNGIQAEAAQIAEAMEYRRAVRLRTTDLVSGPVVVGLLQPTIVLPEKIFERLPKRQRALALAHEIAHLRRNDLWLSLIPSLAQTLFWFHPLAWLAAREFAHNREAACDTDVLQITGEASEVYGEMLLGFLSVRTPASPRFGLYATSGYQELHRRLTMLQTLTPCRPPLRRPYFVVLLTLCILALLPWRLIAAPQGSDNPLQGNERLDRKVTVSVEGIPVGELLKRLSEKTGIKLEARPIAAEDKVILFSSTRPLREVMSDLAALFNDDWMHSKTESGTEIYTLTRFGRAEQYEASLAALPMARIAAQLDAQVLALSETPEQLAQRPSTDPIRTRLTDTEVRLTTQLYAGLSSDQRDSLFAQTTLNMPFSALSPTQQTAVHKQYDAWLTRARKEQVEAGTTDTIVVRDFDRQGITFSVLQRFGSVAVYAEPLGEIGTFSSQMQWALPPHGNPYTQKPLPANAGLPEVTMVDTARQEGDWIGRLRALASSSGRTVVADYYLAKPLTRPDQDPVKPLDQTSSMGALDTLCAADGYLWWTRGKTLLIRKRDWYMQTQYEPSNSLLLALMQRLHAHKNIPTYSDLFSLLDLPLRKIVGLASVKYRNLPPNERQLGEFNENDMAGFPELVAFGKTLWSRPNVPMPTFQGSDAQAALVAAFEPAALSGDQQRLLALFLNQKSGDFASTQADRFQIFMFRGETVSSIDPAAKKWIDVNIQIDAAPASGPQAGARHPSQRFWISLPTELPDDRRDKTRVELVP